MDYRELRESSLVKDESIWMKLLKKVTSERNGVAYRGPCVSLTSDATAIQLKACVLVNGGYFEHPMRP